METVWNAKCGINKHSFKLQSAITIAAITSWFLESPKPHSYYNCRCICPHHNFSQYQGLQRNRNLKPWVLLWLQITNCSEFRNFCRLTKNVKVERGSPLTSCVGAWGAAADSIQIKDCHWFLPSESPTNITVLSFIFSRNSTPLNL